MDRPLEESCNLQLLDFEHPEGRLLLLPEMVLVISYVRELSKFATTGKRVFWHSSAHALGEACERHYGCLLEHGPPTDEGFFYDMALPDGK